MLGFMQEHGPYAMEDGATNFTVNEYSWNKQATVIYFESPAGVGYSICGDPAECAFNDTNAADDNLAAFLALMTTKFPELQGNDLYISGESYAGIYVPLLAERIDWYLGNCTISGTCTYKPNLKGFMVGNGVTDYKYDLFPGTFEMAFWFGFIDMTLYNNLKTYCIPADPEPAQCTGWW